MADQELLEQVGAVVDAYCDAIHTGDEAALRAVFTGDATDTLISQSTLYEGPDAIACDFLGKLHELYATITLVNDGFDAHLLTPDVAVVVFRYHTECVRAETGEPYGIEGLETQVPRLLDGVWKIAHIQYHGKTM